MPPAIDASEMNSAYGKVIRSISAARRPCSVSAPKPGANSGMIHGARSTAAAVSTSRKAVRVPATRSISSFTAACPWRLLYSASTGTKAIENEPSADSRRMKRSEEHTSELQSLMRISYAVFSLKKKLNNTQQTYIKQIQYNAYD